MAFRGLPGSQPFGGSAGPMFAYSAEPMVAPGGFNYGGAIERQPIQGNATRMSWEGQGQRGMMASNNNIRQTKSFQHTIGQQSIGYHQMGMQRTNWQQVQNVEMVPVQQVQMQQVQMVDVVPVQQVVMQEVVQAVSPPPMPVVSRAVEPPKPRVRDVVNEHIIEVPVDKIVEVPLEVEIDKYDFVPVDRIVYKEVPVDVERVETYETPHPVERIQYREVPVFVDVEVERVVERISIKEVPVDKVVIKEVPYIVDKTVTKEVPVYIDREVEKVVPREVPIDKIFIKEVPVEVEKVVTKEVPVPYDKIVDRVVEVPFDRVIFQDKIVYQDKVVYQDKLVEVPVERFVTARPAGGDAGMRHMTAQQTSMYQSQGVQGVGQGRKVGLGLLLKTENDGLTYVKETIQGFAASLQGATMPNDCIIAVDGRSVEGWELDAIKQLTFGEEGQPCQLTLRRGNETFTVNLVRVVPSQSQLD